MRIYKDTLKAGIARTKEFEKKGLAKYAVNVGTRCGHDCTYCSSPALLRMHQSFKKPGLNPFEKGYAIVDPATPERVKRDAARIHTRGLVQLCTTVDAWSPEAQEYDLGRRCLKAILSEPKWTVRILTKNAAVLNDFDIIEKHKDRVLLGLSVTAPPEKQDMISCVEPNASPISERIAVMDDAAQRGFRTYAMFCPLMPGISDNSECVGQLIQLAESWNAEEIFVEAVNARANGLILTQEALEKAGFHTEAAKIQEIRNKKVWNNYVVNLIKTVQNSFRQNSSIEKLKILQYPSSLTTTSISMIKQNEAGVIWL